VFADAVFISARTGMGLERLTDAVLAKYKGAQLLLRVVSSQSNGRVPGFLRAYGSIIKEQYSDGQVLIDARLGRNQLSALKRLGVDKLEILQDKTS